MADMKQFFSIANMSRHIFSSRKNLNASTFIDQNIWQIGRQQWADLSNVYNRLAAEIQKMPNLRQKHLWIWHRRWTRQNSTFCRGESRSTDRSKFLIYLGLESVESKLKIRFVV